jgi:hypothetical protein
MIVRILTNMSGKISHGWKIRTLKHCVKEVMMSETIAILSVSCKPYHNGHHLLIKRASQECDIVRLFVSTADRKRGGEAVVLGVDMHNIFVTQIEPILPKNVKVIYGGSPVSNAWELVGVIDKTQPLDVSKSYTLYGDPTDINESFPQTSLAKYTPNLLKLGLIKTVSVSRLSTVNVSGTMMRVWLQTGNKEEFCNHLPVGVDNDLSWNTLKTSADNELIKRQQRMNLKKTTSKTIKPKKKL